MYSVRAFLLALISVGSLAAANVAIGQMQLTYGGGFQQLLFNNMTDTVTGCQEGVSQYTVCSGANIESWTLTLTFTNENPGNASPSYGLYSSPLVITSGPSENIAPGVSGYSGISTTWQIPLDFQGADDLACPPCDYQLTKVEFSGTLSATDLPLKLGNSATYNGADSSTYTTFSPPATSPTFDDTWLIPPSDYTSLDPTFAGQLLFDQTDITVSDQPLTTPGVPEPGTVLLVSAGLAAAIGYRKRNIFQ